MSMRHLGSSFDVHTGGVDLVFPAPRGRDRAERGRDRPAVRADLAPLRPPADGRREDGEVHGQHRPRRGPPRGGRLAARAAVRALAVTLPDGALFGPTRSTRRPPPSTGWTPCGRLSPPTRTTRRTMRSSGGAPGRSRGVRAGLDDDLNVSPALAAVFDLVRELNRRIAGRSISTADAARARAVLRGPGPCPGPPARRGRARA